MRIAKESGFVPAILGCVPDISPGSHPDRTARWRAQRSAGEGVFRRHWTAEVIASRQAVRSREVENLRSCPCQSNPNRCRLTRRLCGSQWDWPAPTGLFPGGRWSGADSSYSTIDRDRAALHVPSVLLARTKNQRPSEDA